MFCSVLSATIVGVEAARVTVEADAGNGMPQFSIVGHVSAQVRESLDRVRTALKNHGVQLPPKRITINLSPGDLRKDGTRFDLPIAVAVLGAIGRLDPADLGDAMFIGELHLDGVIGAVTGVLPSVLLARELGVKTCFVPHENLKEARIVSGIHSVGIRDLDAILTGEIQEEGALALPDDAADAESVYPLDFSDIHGQSSMKRCALIAAAGFHNLLFSGPPGAGKSMAARRIPTIMPALTREEQLEISRLYSVAGLLPAEHPLIRTRPFRDPHHSLTAVALCGGGRFPRPGEVTLAHRGVLFLDELPEMRRETLEMLRQPLEDHQITLSRMGGSFRFPASFLLVAAMNPCPCGYYPDRERCSCSDAEISAYRRRISHAFLDRIDLQCEVRALRYEELTEKRGEEGSSVQMRALVTKAAAIQRARYEGEAFHFNSEIPSSAIRRFCVMTGEAERLLSTAFDALGLSARGCHHLMRVARTIADLEGEEVIGSAHISEAISCRCGE